MSWETDSPWPLDEQLGEAGAVEGKWSSLLFLLDKQTILDRLVIKKKTFLGKVPASPTRKSFPADSEQLFQTSTAKRGPGPGCSQTTADLG